MFIFIGLFLPIACYETGNNACLHDYDMDIPLIKKYHDSRTTTTGRQQ